MLRNVNVMSKYEFEYKIAICVHFAQHTVLKLTEEQKANFNKYLLPDVEKNIKNGRSSFSPIKKNIAISLLSCQIHPIFNLLKELYFKIDNIEIKNYILEITYYMNRLNEKFIEYEN